MNKSNPPPRLAVEMPDGKTAWFKIVGVEPGWNDITTTMTITGGEQLEMGTYQATLVEADKRTVGHYGATMCISSVEPIRFVGYWTPDKQPG